jgi:peptidoglycan hydrolase-like protein with peptidoglycan-binding domain
MKRISQAFNPNNKRSVKNLHQVLRYLSPELAFKDERALDEETEEAIERLVKPGEPILKDGKLNQAVISEINEALVTKKYEDPGNIAQLHRDFRTLRKKKFVKLDIAEEEIKRNEIGDSTQAFIAAFQKKYKLPPTGRLDAATDEKLESVITSIAGSKPQPKKLLKTKNVAELTRVVRALRLNKSGERVQHLQKGLAWLGYTIHDEEFRAQTYGITTKNAVKQFQSERGLPITGRVDKDTARAINLELGQANPKILTCEKIRVRGSVRDELWQGKGGVTVRVYQKGLAGNDTLLGERRTFRNGFYDVFFTPPQDPSKAPLHLVVKIFDGNQELDSKTYYNVKKVLWVNFSEGEDRYQGISEFERLLKSLSPPLKAANLKIGDIEQSDTRQDILFLYRETGILPETIMKLSLAHRIANEVNQADLPPAVFYAFLRQNLPPELPTDLFPDEPDEWHQWLPRVVDRVTNGLVFLESDIQQAALDNAFAQNYIPRHLKV